MRNYMKNDSKRLRISKLVALDFLKNVIQHKSFILKRSAIVLSVVALVVPIAFGLPFVKNAIKNVKVENDMPVYLSVPEAATSSKMNTISIPSGMAKANPFVPYRDIGDSVVDDVPKFELVAPPEDIKEGVDAVRIMDTVVSGILYDAYNPSAILNIEGVDYLVKKGDTVNNYKIVSIAKDCVTVKLGSNVYKAGIGEILTDGTINENNVSNLNKKFGGERR